MKRIFVIIACAALIMACGGNKAQNSECDKCKTECSNQEKVCNKKCDKQECADKKCSKQECDKKCTKQKCDAEKKCEKQECGKKCTKQECTKQETAGCIQLDAESFAKLVADLSQPEWKYLGDKPAVVDFYADWCGPCKAISPILEEIAKEYAGQLYIYKINVDDTPEIANAFNIQAIPTLLFIPTEGRYTVKTGGMPKEELVNMIKENCFK